MTKQRISITIIFSIHKSLGILANRDIIGRYIDGIRRKITHFGDRFSLSRLHSQEAVFRLNNNSKIGDISSVLSTILQIGDRTPGRRPVGFCVDE